MKKVLRIVLIIVLMMSMLVGLTACNDEDDEEESSSRSSKSSRQEREEEILDTARDVYAEARETIKSGADQMNQIEIETFNSVFTSFEGKSQLAPAARDLISKIVSTNSANPEKALGVEFNGEEYKDSEIASLRSKCQSNKNYDISFEYSKNGYIETAIINESTYSGIGTADDEVLKRAEDAAEKTRIGTAKESLQMAISSLSTNFMAEWMNDQTLTIGGYVLQSNLQQELKDYQIKSYNKNTGEGVMEDADGYQYSFTLQEKNAYLMDITEFEAMD